MGAGIYITVGVSVLVVLGVVAVVLGRRGRKRVTPLSVGLRDLAIRSVPRHAAWYVDLKVDFLNHGAAPVSVTAVNVIVVGPDASELKPNRILGDKSARKYDHMHPPDVILRLPLLVEPARRATYRFHVFFTAHLHQFWPKGVIRFYATSTGGVTAQTESTLGGPLVFPANPVPQDRNSDQHVPSHA